MTLEENGPEMILLAIRGDAGPFYKVAGSFGVNKSQWVGNVVASPLAVYLLKTQMSTQGYGGGIAGMMLASAMAKDDGLSTCTAGDLPEPVRAVLDPKGKLAAKNVVIVPKSTVSLVKWKGGNFVVQSGGDKFKFAPGLFSGGKAKKELAAMGWELNKEMTPTAAPVHDMRSDAERTAPPQAKPLWVRVLLILGAMAIIAAYIAIRIAARH